MTENIENTLIFKKKIFLTPYISVFAYLAICTAVLVLLPPRMFSAYSLLGGLLLPLFGARDFLKSRHRLLFSQQGVVVKGIFTNKKMHKEQILGYHSHYRGNISRYISRVVFSEKMTDRTLTIRPSSYKNTLGIMEYLTEHFENLDLKNS